MSDFDTKYKFYLDIINKRLDRYTCAIPCNYAILYDSMRYSLMCGGKRIRPILALAVCEMLDKNIENVIPYACAIEMIHTFSLIHDDLPCMDNDDYRRGKLTNHKIYPEAIALLAGDSLQNLAFDIMIADLLKDKNIARSKVRAMQVISTCSGANGMIGGQVIDLQSESKKIDISLLKEMHNMKTSALIKAPILASAILCDVNSNVLNVLEDYANNIGLAFQIKDDIMDVEGDVSLMGKNAGSDVSRHKSTFVTAYGLEQSKQMLLELTEKSLSILKNFSSKSGFLSSLTLYLSNRSN